MVNKPKLLLIGCGDVAWRALPALTARYRVFAVLRDTTQVAKWRDAGAIPLLADLDQLTSLRRVAALADFVLHLAPPPNQGQVDQRTQNLLAALRQHRPRCLVYVSTTGVYGDCNGAVIDETRHLNPQSPRAMRRVDAETRLRHFAQTTNCRVVILRAPGIYAAERLPLERLQRGIPALIAAEDVYSNHIHADDLAQACVLALHRGKPNRVYNVVDHSDLRMADYFDLVAQHFALPQPPRLPRSELAQIVSPMQLSFMQESRRIKNERCLQELGLSLLYPDITAGLAAEGVR